MNPYLKSVSSVLEAFVSDEGFFSDIITSTLVGGGISTLSNSYVRRTNEKESTKAGVTSYQKMA